MNPLTVDPCCSSSNKSCWLFATEVVVSHVPVTSTVTSVRSIQSFCAQPIKDTSEIPRSTRAIRLIPSARRRVRLGTRARPVKGGSLRTPLAENPAHHIVSADGQLPAEDSTLIPEGEYIARHVSFDGNA